MKSIPLEDLHIELGAKFGPFAGYNMPIQYPMGLKGEHLHTRSHAGLFDVSHMGQLRITSTSDLSGEKLRQELETVLPCDFNNWPNNVQRYSVLLNDTGGIEDDLMLVWRDAAPKAAPEVRMVVNAGNRDHDLALLKRLAPNLQFEWVDAALVALQGPDAESVLSALDARASQMTFMQACDLNLMGVQCFTTRSGYTGEDGYEISIPSKDADRIVRAIIRDARVKPVGLGARIPCGLRRGCRFTVTTSLLRFHRLRRAFLFQLHPLAGDPRQSPMERSQHPPKRVDFPVPIPCSNTLLAGHPENFSA